VRGDLTYAAATRRAQVTRPYTAEDSGKWVAVVCFECRGCDVVRWHPGDDGWTVRTAGGSVFNDQNLSEDWTEWDEKKGEGCSIMALEHKVEVRR